MVHLPSRNRLATSRSRRRSGARTCCRVHGKPHHSKTAPDPMRVRWTPAAADDLQSIANYLFEKTPANAARLIREIYAVPPSLTRFSKLWPYRKEGSYARVGNAILPLCHCLSGPGRYSSHGTRASRSARLVAMNPLSWIAKVLSLACSALSGT